MNALRRKEVSFKSVLVLAFMAFCLILAGSPAMGQDAILSSAPLNPNFLEYQNNMELGARQVFTADGHPLGEIPAPVDLSHLKANAISAEERATIPAKYDSRSKGWVTSVKDQGNCGSCWTFATYGSLESYLKKKSGKTFDFSEEDMNDKHGFDPPACQGGNPWMSSAYLARWSGPYNESDIPYLYSDARAAVKKHVQDVVFLPGRTSFTDNNPTKKAIMKYGAVYLSMYWHDNFYNSTTASYYMNTTTSIAGGGGHAVTIVGWDDSYSKSNFKAAPPGNGAFLIKNSWGTSWGKKGYFYISYYDQRIAPLAVFNKADATTKYKKAYQYDKLGWVETVGFGAAGNPVAWIANVFKSATGANKIKAVSFYATSTNAAYTVYIYDKVSLANGNPRQGVLRQKKSGTFADAGYHTVRFDNSPATTTAGKLFSVVVKIKTPGYNWPMAIEEPASGYSTSANAAPKQSYVSPDGASWDDITSYGGVYEQTNVCVKAFGTN